VGESELPVTVTKVICSCGGSCGVGKICMDRCDEYIFRRHQSVFIMEGELSEFGRWRKEIEDRDS